MTAAVEPDFSAFWSKVEIGDVCWFWLGGRIPEGYGVFYYAPQQSTGAHRFSYEIHHGPIPEGMVIDHLCRNRACVRPDHLEAVTNRENVLRGVGLSAENARKTECHRGHPFDEANTYHHNGQRMCRQCRRAADKAWRQRKAAK